MEINNPDPHDPRIELEIAREKLKSSGKHYLQQKQQLQKALNELTQIREERNQFLRDLEVTKAELKFTTISLDQSKQKLEDKKKSGKILVSFGSIIFLSSTVFVTWGINYLTTNPPILAGWPLLIAGIALYLLGIAMTTWLAFGGSD